MYDKNPVSYLGLAAALIASTACTGSSSFTPPSLASGETVQVQAALGVDAAASSAAVQAVEAALPELRGLPPGQQLRTLRWMLSVSDDRRLVSLFADLNADQEEALDQRAITARQRLEDLAGGLERAGHQAAEPEAEIAQIDPNAPPPNYFPPAMIQELERRKDLDPEAARALEEAHRASPRGVRPPAG